MRCVSQAVSAGVMFPTQVKLDEAGIVSAFAEQDASTNSDRVGYLSLQFFLGNFAVSGSNHRLKMDCDELVCDE